MTISDVEIITESSTYRKMTLVKERKEANLNIRCTQEEKDKCKERAKEAGLSVSAWIIKRCC